MHFFLSFCTLLPQKLCLNFQKKVGTVTITMWRTEFDIGIWGNLSQEHLTI